MDEQPSVHDSMFNNTSNEINFGSFEPKTWMQWSLIPACAIVILFSFLEKRVHLWPTTCDGRPGVAFPVNLVDSYTNRWAFAFAFGSMSTVLVRIFAIGTLIVDSSVIDNADIMLTGTIRFFAILIDSLVISLVFYPILLCLQTRWKLLGNIIGLLYSIVWLVYYVGGIITAASGQITGQNETLLDQQKFYLFLAYLTAYGSGIICNSALVICFIVGLTKEFRRGINLAFKVDNDTPRMDFNETHFYHRVKFLLSPPMPQKTGGNIIVRLFRKYIGTVPGFRFSRRNICTFVLSIVVTIQVVLAWIYIFGNIQLQYEYIFRTYPEIEQAIQKVTIPFWVTSGVSIICTAVYSIDMQLRYRKHTLMLWKGDRSFAPEGKLKFSATLVASLRYSGYHVAFTVWGFVVLQLVLWLILSCIILLWDEVFIILLKQYWLSLVITLAFYYGQVYISRIVFLQMAPDPQQEARWICVRETTFGLDNRRVFHVTLYILMIVNFILGLLSCFLRLLEAVLVGTLYIGRLDRLLLMRDWELFDFGYTAYVGFLQLEVAHTHPVLVTFCHFLLRTVKTDQDFTTSYDLVSIVDAQINNGCGSLAEENSGCYSSGGPTKHQLSRRMRNKWLVALTLSRNPQLVSERKGALIKETGTVPSISDDIAEKSNRYSVDEAYA